MLKIPISPALHDPLLKVTLACLVASSSDLAIWLGPGRRTIERAWSTSQGFAVCISGALLDAGWGGVKQFAIAPFCSNVSVILKNEENEDVPKLRALRVLAKMAKTGHMKSMDENLKDELAVWVTSWLRDFKVSEKSVRSPTSLGRTILTSIRYKYCGNYSQYTRRFHTTP